MVPEPTFGAPILTLPVASSVNSGILLHLSEPWFSHLCDGAASNALLPRADGKAKGDNGLQQVAQPWGEGGAQLVPAVPHLLPRWNLMAPLLTC